MAQLMDYVHYLAKEIGPRPAGTEEEQQAALYITEQFQKDTGFAANIEEFESSSNLEGARAVLAGVAIIVTVLAMIFSVLTIPAFILAAAAAAIYSLEAYDRPIVSRLLSHGASQNVIAKYQPNQDPEGSNPVRSRKIVLVAHYDTGRAVPTPIHRLRATGLPLDLIYIVAMIASAVFLFLRLFIAPAGGGVLVILNILSVIAILVCLLPVAKAIMLRTAPYNEGANNNATGTAALLEVARRISRGSVSEADLSNNEGDVVIHGEQAAIESGLVPEGAQIRYEAEQLVPPSELGEYDEEERLLAAKAAIAALTGKPVERRVYGSVADKLVNSRVQEGTPIEPSNPGFNVEQPDANAPQPFEQRSSFEAPQHFSSQRDADITAGASSDISRSSANPAQDEPEPETVDIEGFHNAPSWFVAAQQNAKRPVFDDASEIHRSRYTEAIENAEKGRIERERAEQERLQQEAEQERLAMEQRVRAEEAARSAILAQSLEEAEQSLDMLSPVEDIQPNFSGRISSVLDSDDATTPTSSSPIPRRLVTSEGDVGAESAAAASTATSAPASAEFAAAPSASVASTFDTPAIASAEGEAMEASSADSSDDPFGAPSGNANASPSTSLDLVADQQLDRDLQADLGRVSSARQMVNVPEIASLDEQPSNPSPTRSRIANLPTIDSSHPSSGAPTAAPMANDPSRSGKLRNIRASVPSLSGVIRTQNEARQNVASSLPNVVNVPTPIDVAPVANQSGAVEASNRAVAPASGARSAASVEQVDYDMEIPADYSSNAPVTGSNEGDDRAASARGDDARTNVDIPKTRSGGLLNRIRGRDREPLDESPQEWLDVDDDFDARSVGKARGSWESFRNNDLDDAFDDPFSDSSDADFGDFGVDDDNQRQRKRRWQGGAYSRMQLGHVNMRSGEDAEADEVIPADSAEIEAGRSITGEIEQIYHFRNPSFSTEIWFVAMGSDTEAHDGAKAFLDAHRSELRGSMIIEIESLGAGTLSVASQEGTLKKVSASSRIKRYTRDAVAVTGLALDEVNLSGSDSIASIVQKAGFQSMHLFGAEDGRPALKGSADDVLENVNELLLDDNVNFIFELLKHQ